MTGPIRIGKMLSKEIDRVEDEAREIEAAGFDAAWTGESNHEPFIHLALAARATDSLTIGSSVAIAFARTPMLTAHAAWDLQAYARGRFTLGLGSQVKAHIERRFAMPWSHPAARMREYVLALRAIWASWSDDSRLDFRGDFYQHTLMTPFFAPERHEWGPPPVFLAGVGSRLTEVAGEVCDGFLFHPFTTRRYLTEVTMPALERGRKTAGASGSFQVGGQVLIGCGRNEDQLAAAVAGVRKQLAFYASTAAYLPVLELHGWERIQPELANLAKEGRWSEQAGLVDDDMVRAFAVCGSPKEVATALSARLGGVADHAVLQVPRGSDRTVLDDVAAAWRA